MSNSTSSSPNSQSQEEKWASVLELLKLQTTKATHELRFAQTTAALDTEIK